MSDLFIAFSLGLLSAPHCIGMCGSIATALLMSARRSAQLNENTQVLRLVPAGANAQYSQQAPTSHALNDALLFGSGKLLAYVTLGVIVGLIGFAIGSLGEWPGRLLRGFSSLLIIAIGLYVAGWWRGILHLEKFGARVWQPALSKFGKIDMSTRGNKLFAGALWGFLPCGIVYSALGLALASGSIGKAAAMMVSFGLGTMPFVLSTGGLMQVAAKGLKNPIFKQLAGAAMILLGVFSLLLVMGIQASPHSH